MASLYNLVSSVVNYFSPARPAHPTTSEDEDVEEDNTPTTENNDKEEVEVVVEEEESTSPVRNLTDALEAEVETKTEGKTTSEGVPEKKKKGRPSKKRKEEENGTTAESPKKEGEEAEEAEEPPKKKVRKTLKSSETPVKTPKKGAAKTPKKETPATKKKTTTPKKTPATKKTPKKQEKQEEESEEEKFDTEFVAKFQVGEEIEAKFTGVGSEYQSWFNGSVKAVLPEKHAYSITWEDDITDDVVKAKFVRKRSPVDVQLSDLSKGQAVLGYLDPGYWFSAHITEIETKNNKPRISVTWDDKVSRKRLLELNEVRPLVEN